jgi:hypothetical protein
VSAVKMLCCYSCKKRMGVQGRHLGPEDLAPGKLRHSRGQSN